MKKTLILGLAALCLSIPILGKNPDKKPNLKIHKNMVFERKDYEDFLVYSKHIVEGNSPYLIELYDFDKDGEFDLSACYRVFDMKINSSGNMEYKTKENAKLIILYGKNGKAKKGFSNRNEWEDEELEHETKYTRKGEPKSPKEKKKKKKPEQRKEGAPYNSLRA